MKKQVEYAVIEENTILFRSRWKRAAKCFRWHLGSGQIVKMHVGRNPTWMTPRKDDADK